jgi:methyltransferase
VTPIIPFAIVLAVLMLAESWRSRRNEAELRRQGAIEPRDDVYAMMQIAYPGSFALMALEGLVGGRASAPVAGLALFAIAKVLKYWAIASLGSRWCFRVLVPPGAPAVVGGPYRWVRHPNYVAVALELVAAGLVCGAWVTGPVAVVGFCVLMWRRIAVEERALGLR